ncbi:Uncharacterized membrane protein [Maridesulfovibrio ferrireducens]|uniref:Uncharacterized membrane protein n=1 Tax=Maridesulfovibrio ferrireducens TaxID=246191 RepID=A0A1G9IYA7_9BACT|nr:PACE efflux transporter [Maridesulfovibrio ferrireducens]SDL30237.1 Uncharacterized membrane protein [Maridesulfovibrio ferrireducens]
MRTCKDRLRHTILFEILLILIIGPMLSIILEQPLHTMGALTIILSLIAMVINYIYNLAFDHSLKQLGKSVHKRSKRLRVLHSILFELVLFIFSVPIVMNFMGYTFMEAFILDIGFIIMVPVYAFFFNILYDNAFPIVSIQ